MWVSCRFRILGDSHLSLADGIPADIHSQMFCELLLLALALQAGDRGVELSPSLLGGTLAAEIALWIPRHSRWERSQLFSTVLSFYQSPRGFFCESLVIRFLVSESSVGCSG